MAHLQTQIVLPAATAHRIHIEALLDEALAASFPSSDPIAIDVPSRTADRDTDPISLRRSRS